MAVAEVRVLNDRHQGFQMTRQEAEAYVAAHADYHLEDIPGREPASPEPTPEPTPAPRAPARQRSE